MKPPVAVSVVLLLSLPASLLAQASSVPASDRPPTLAEVRAAMGIPSSGEVRGQMDTVGFASTAAQMARTWQLSTGRDGVDVLGPAPAPGVAGALAPHDDYIYAARVYRTVLPLVTARTVVLIGVFHKYRRFGMRDALVFDDYRAWRTPDGEIRVSPLRADLLAGLAEGDAVQDAAMHDAEHSLEAVAYWLRHTNPDIEIVPVLVPAMPFERMEELASRLGGALARAIERRGWRLGRDVSVLISSDAVHYGPDFPFTPFGDGGIEAYARAADRDRELLRGPLAGPIDAERIRLLFAAFVDPEQPDVYRLTWCGRFSIPFGMLLLARTAAALGEPALIGRPIAYATSVGQPELPLRDVGLGETAPANLFHFVGYPALAFTAGGS